MFISCLLASEWKGVLISFDFFFVFFKMVKFSLVALLVLISLAYVMSAPASNEGNLEVDTAAGVEVEDVQPSATKKTKRGIYGGGYGLGYGHYPYSFGHFGGYGHGYGYGHYPYYSLGYHGYGHGYGGYGHGYGHYLW